MDIIRQKIKVHQSLHELFGRETTGLDLIAILIGSAVLTITAQMLCMESELSLTKKIILAFLSLDIGGGVIANFTEGTNNYYSESVQRRYLFIAIHILQPLVLSWIFTGNLITISIITAYTLISSVIITSIKEKSIQKTIAPIMLLIGIILGFLLHFSHPVLQLILLIYSIKLVLAFSVNWSKSEQ